MEKKKKRIGARAAIVIAIIVIGLFLALINFITDILWFGELGYIAVFLTQLKTELLVGVPLFIVLTLVGEFYLSMLRKGYFKKVESAEKPNTKTLKIASWVLSGVAALLVSFYIASNLWFEMLKYANSTDFGIAEPLFNLDVAFYIFKLQFIQELNEMAIGIVVVYAVVTLIYYLILLSLRTPQMFEEKEESAYEGPGFYDEYGNFHPDHNANSEERYSGNDFGGNGGSGFGAFGGFGMNFDPSKLFKRGGQTKKTKKQFDDDNFMQLISIASKQLITLGVIFFLMVGANFFLKQYDLLYSGTGVLYGAGYTDIKVTLLMYRVLIVLSVLGAIFFAIGISKRKLRQILIIPALMVIVGAVGYGAGIVVQNFVVSPNEITLESPYLERNIAFTKYAYGLDDVSVRDFPANNSLTLEDIENNSETISNIRINDYEPVETFYNQTQAIRQYYTFRDVDVDRYMVNGEYTQTYTSTREIDESAIRSEWLNQHLKYTHGYGITMSRVDKITPSGQPDVLIADVPPVSEVAEIEITRPEIYFGEMTNNYLLVNTDEEEFDYPYGESNTYTEYEGTAGIKLNLLNRLMFAIREGDIKMLVSTNIDSESRIIINRNIMRRVQKIMPNLAYESDPYMVTVDGRLFWMLDAYTTSNYYPYSEPYAQDTYTNYIRNSVKVVIDAYNGTVDYYIVDENDPIALTYQKIYPTLFKDFDEMPEGLKEHIRYPNTMFNIQANVYQRYHMSDVRVFYQGEDLWSIATEMYGKTEQTIVPNYFILKLPGEEKAEFVNQVPYTPRNRRNMTGLLVGRNDGEHYGELILYQLPKSRVIYGPMQVEAMIDQNTEISRDFSLWDSSGSTYSRGNMFVIPVEDSLLYVEPIYLEAANSSIPEVKRVIVVYNDKIAYEETLEEALVSMFGASSAGVDEEKGSVTEVPEGSSLSLEQLAQLAKTAFDNAEAAQKRGDWAGYGSYLDQLERYLTLMNGDSEEAGESVEAEAIDSID